MAFRIEILSRLLIDIELSEVVINSIATDQSVTITFDTVKGKTYHGKGAQINQSGDDKSGAVHPPFCAWHAGNYSKNIINAMQKHGIQRLISTGGTVVRNPHDQPELVDNLIKALIYLRKRRNYERK